MTGGDLTAPASTNYAITQTGTPQSIIGSGSSAREANVALSTALTGSTIWGSFLVNLNGGTVGRGGIQFNAPVSATNPNDPRVLALGLDAQARLDGSGGADINFSNALTSNATALILFSIDFDPAGNDTMNMWVNPDVANLGAPLSFSTADWLGASGITTVSVFSYSSGALPLVDAFRLSDDADAYFQVTGIPEPSGGALLLLSLAGVAVYRLRR